MFLIASSLTYRRLAHLA